MLEHYADPTIAEFQPFLRFNLNVCGVVGEYIHMFAAISAGVSTLLEILQVDSECGKRRFRADAVWFQPFLRFYVSTRSGTTRGVGAKFQPFLRFYTTATRRATRRCS